jgi:hypothetical protein
VTLVFGIGLVELLVLLFVGVLVAGIVVLVVLARRGQVDDAQGLPGVGQNQVMPGAQVDPVQTADELGKLAELHRRGDLSDEEFTAAKNRLLR